MKEQLTTAQRQNKKKEKYDTHPLSLYPNPKINEPPPNLVIPPSLEVTIHSDHVLGTNGACYYHHILITVL